VPNIKSAIKRVEVAERNRQRNRFWKSNIRTAINAVEDNVDANKVKEATDAMSKVFATIDKAVSKGVLHKNTAARRKARLAARVVKASAKK
jgi:ribosomal protein S20